jgi:putative transposase
LLAEHRRALETKEVGERQKGLDMEHEGGGSLGTLDDVRRKEAFDRYALLKPFLDEGVPLTAIAQETGVPLRTLRRWVSRYRSEGLASLARKERSDKGRDRLAGRSGEVILALALGRPGRSLAAIHRKAAEVAQREGWSEPTYDQVRAFVGRIDPALAKLAREGAKSYGQAYDLLRRGEAARPNDVWQADHTLLDIRVLDEDGGSRRPWLTVVLDDHSRAVAGYNLSFDAPSAAQTALALRRAIWRKEEPRWPVCGVPDVLYTDNGSDFTSRRMEQVAADLPMRLVFSTPGQPRGRGKVERFFGTVNQMLLAELPGYLGGGGGGKASLTLDRLDAAFRSWLLDVYHRLPRGKDKKTPVQRWEAGGFLPRMPESLEQLDLLLLTEARTRKVRRDGIHFKTYRYLDLVLAAYVGEDVVIRYDPRDLAEVRVYLGGAFLCRAVCPELSGETVSLREVRNASARRRRELRSQLKENAGATRELLAFRKHEDPGAETPDAPVASPGAPTRKRRKIKRYADD